MKRIYFFEADPESTVWEKTVDTVNGEITTRTPWIISEKRNLSNQKITHMKNSKIFEMTEQDIKEFTEFVKQVKPSNMDKKMRRLA